MKENSAKSIVTGMIIKTVLMVILVLLLLFAAKRAYRFGYQIFAQEAMSDPLGKKVAVTITKDTVSSFGVQRKTGAWKLCAEYITDSRRDAENTEQGRREGDRDGVII